MKDKYLHTFRREPNHEYTEKLYQQLERVPLAAVTSSPQSLPSPAWNRKLAWAFTVLVSAFLLMAFVPGARAWVEDVIRQIGGLVIFETEQYPGVDNPIIVPDEIMTLEEARSYVDFEFSLPAWVPNGLTLQEDDVRFSSVTEGLNIQWTQERRNDIRILNLMISEAMAERTFVVGPESVTELAINDAPAMLIRGSWDADLQEWRDTGYRALRWQLDGVVYQLSSGPEEFGGFSDEQLIQVAESIQ